MLQSGSIHGVLLKLASALNVRFDGEKATEPQIDAVRIYLQQFTKKDKKRYRLIGELFNLREVPKTSRVLTKGQASALITIMKHPVYGPMLDEFIDSLERQITT